MDNIIMIAAQAYTSVQEHPLVAEDMQKAIRFGAELTRMLIENEPNKLNFKANGKDNRNGTKECY